MTGLCHEDVQFNIPIKIGTDVDRRSQAFNASERCRHPIIHQPTASPSADNVTEPLLTKIGHKSNYGMKLRNATVAQWLNSIFDWFRRSTDI